MFFSINSVRKLFSFKLNLINHMNRNSGLKNIKCTDYKFEKKFVTFYEIDAHISRKRNKVQQKNYRLKVICLFSVKFN
jgi:hypothetical protein